MLVSPSALHVYCGHEAPHFPAHNVCVDGTAIDWGCRSQVSRAGVSVGLGDERVIRARRLAWAVSNASLWAGEQSIAVSSRAG